MEKKIEIGRSSAQSAATLFSSVFFLCVLCGKIYFANCVRQGANSMSFGTTMIDAVHDLPANRRTDGSKIGSFGTANRVCEKVPKTQTCAAQRLSGNRPGRADSKTRKNRGGAQDLGVMAATWWAIFPPSAFENRRGYLGMRRGLANVRDGGWCGEFGWLQPPAAEDLHRRTVGDERQYGRRGQVLGERRVCRTSRPDRNPTRRPRPARPATADARRDTPTCRRRACGRRPNSVRRCTR